VFARVVWTGLAALLLAAPPAGAATRSCAPANAHLKAATTELVVYRDPAKHNALRACSVKTRETIELDDPDDDSRAFRRVVVRGRFVAWAVNNSTDGDVSTYVRVSDARKFDSTDDEPSIVHFAYADLSRHGYDASASVGRIVLAGNGNVAWTSCPPTDKRSTRPRLKPNCLRPGALDRVYRLAGKERVLPTLVGKGREIHPGSLRLSGNTLSWIERGRWRAVPLGFGHNVSRRTAWPVSRSLPLG
jgi:hypothetical protein